MELLTKEDVSEIAGRVAAAAAAAGGGGKARLLDHELSKRSEETLGYLGKHFILTLKLSSEEGIARRRLFLKTYEVRADREDFLGETGIFERERDFYRIFVEDVKECVGHPDWCPEYHFSKERVLVLEDLSESGFEMVEGGRGPWALDEAHLEAALGALASMHAASMLLERRRRRRLPAAYPAIFGKEMLYDESDEEAPARKWVTWQIQDLLEGVQYLDKYSSGEKKLIKKKFENQIMRIYALSKKSDKYRNVLTHGDVWKNNLLFLHSDEGLPEACKLVDFQFVRYAPPAHDVMHLLCYASKKEARNSMGPRLLRVYYESLRKRMQSSGADVEEDVKPEEFEESCKEYRELALIQCLLSLHYILGPATLPFEAESYGKYEDHLRKHRKGYVAKFFEDENYADRIGDIFQELVDDYILKR